ncbi:MAG TPA: DUF6516 family protein [Anaerolineae bacterium]|nr:DUF6516 family protein [Anaerolineae bacterium]HQI84647.1 DUF6516 family protein [Anaerolineae bacterium]
MDAQTHLAEIYARLSISPIVASFVVLESRDARDYGYFRARLTLINHDHLELAEYFVVTNEQIQVIRYRYQWMDAMFVLKKRWDNAKHHPGILNFPHHIHIGTEGHVISGDLLHVVELLTVLEQELTHEI